MGTLAYHLKREGIGFAGRFGSRGVLLHAAILAVFGLWWPHLRGIEFFDPVFLTAYACLGVLFAGPAAAQAFQKRPGSMAEAAARILWAFLYGEVFALLILAAGIAMVLKTRAVPIDPNWAGLASAVLLGISGTFAVASVAAWLAIRFSPGAARLALRGIFLGLLVVFFFKSRWLPDIAGRATSVCAGIAILAFFAIQRAIQGRE